MSRRPPDVAAEERFRLLLIEDNPGDAELIGSYLADSPIQSCELRKEVELAQARSVLRAEQMDAVLLDLGLPDAQGFDALTELRAEFPELPIVVLTGQQDDLVGIDAIRLGADDFLAKNEASSSLLSRIVVYAVERRRTRRSLTESEEKFQRLFEHMVDGLAVFNVTEADDEEAFGAHFAIVNGPFLGHFGRQHKRVVGRSAFEILPEIELICRPVFREVALRGVPRRVTCHWVPGDQDFEIEVFRNAPDQVTAVFRDITERVRSDRELASQRALLDQVESDAKIGSWRCSLDGETVYWSQELFRIFDLPEAPFGVPFREQRDLFDEGEYEKVKACVETALSEGCPYQLELKLRAVGARARWIEVHGLPERNSSGAIVGLSGFVRDVSVEHEAQSEMRLLATVVATTDNLVVITDPDRRIEWVNHAFEEVSGFTLSEVKGRIPGDFLQGPDTDPETVTFMREKLNRGERFSVVVENFAKDGSSYWVNINAEPLRADDGKIEHFLAVEVDITEAKRREEDLQRYPAILETTGEIANVGGWEVDLETMTPIWTKQTRRIHEVEDDYVPDLEGGLRFYPDDAALVVKEAVDRCVATGESFDLEVPFLTAKGRAIAVRIKGLAERRNGRSVRLYGVIHDVTEQRRIERELVEAKEMAEAANQAKSQFLANMSHEIRTPLNAILGMAELVRATPLPEETKDYLETIRASGDALLALVTDILEFSKIEAGRIDLEESAIGLRMLVEDSLRFVQHLKAGKAVELTAQVAPDLPSQILGDPTRVREVLINLLANAMKFTTAGSVRLLVERGRDMIEGETIRFTVEDTGIGIASEDRGKLFRSFSQVDVSDSRQFGGAGLGLAICGRLVELMGGRIELDSKVGSGSRFYFEIPLKVPTDPEQTLDPRLGTSALRFDPELSTRCPLRILVAEDSAVNQKLIAAVLKKMGYVPEIVGDGLQAFEAARAAEFDVILMDLQMPVLTGREASRQIMADARCQRPEIIALTASVQDGERERCFEAGMSDFLGKPLRPNQLIEALQRSYERRVTAARGS